MKTTLLTASLLGTALACSRGEPNSPPPVESALATQRLEPSVVKSTLDVPGVARAAREATLATKLMGTVKAVLVKEGDVVRAGDLLARVDATDLAAKRSQVDAALASAEAMYADAQRQLARMRKLNEEKAAPRAMLEAAETGNARAEAAVAAARAQGAELAAVGQYAELRAPFAGVVVKRFVDPGAFATPGAPLLMLQDAAALRLAAVVSPEAAAGLARGQTIAVTIEGAEADGTIEGVIPAPQGAMHTVNVIVVNGDGRYVAGGAATIHIPRGERVALLVPTQALLHEGDLVGVRVRGEAGPELRWVRTGRELGSATEVLSGLRAGDEVVVARAGEQ